MKARAAVSLIALMVPAIVAWAGPAAAETASLCIGRKASGLGGASITMALSTVPYGPFVHLAGQSRFSQPIAPPGSLIIYSVAGTASPNDDGWWLALEGAGYDLAGTVFRGTFAIQLGADPSKNTFSYTKQPLDGSAPSTITGTAEIIPCP